MPDSKSGVVKATAGSNPALSAKLAATPDRAPPPCAFSAPFAELGTAVDGALMAGFLRAVELEHDGAACEIALELSRRCEASGAAHAAAHFRAVAEIAERALRADRSDRDTKPANVVELGRRRP